MSINLVLTYVTRKSCIRRCAARHANRKRLRFASVTAKRRVWRLHVLSVGFRYAGRYNVAVDARWRGENRPRYKCIQNVSVESIGDVLSATRRGKGKERREKRTNIPRRFFCIANLIVCQVDDANWCSGPAPAKLLLRGLDFLPNASARRPIQYSKRTVCVGSDRYLDVIFTCFHMENPVRCSVIVPRKLRFWLSGQRFIGTLLQQAGLFFALKFFWNS